MAFEAISGFSEQNQCFIADNDRTLGRHNQTVLLMRPIDQIESNKVARLRTTIGDKDLIEKLDFRYLALTVLDHIFREMALSEGVPESEIKANIKRHTERQVSDIWEDDLNTIAEVVFQGLRNDDGSKFSYNYFDGVSRRFFDFHLIIAHEGTDGRIYFRLTDDAINLLGRSLSYDRATQQEIAEMLLDRAIADGKFAQARAHARDALDNSVGFENQIINLLDSARRRAASVSWSTDVQPITDSALLHITKSLLKENAFLKRIDQQKLDVFGDRSATRELGLLYQTIQQCVVVHNRLQDRIRSAGEQWRLYQIQAFRPRMALRLPDLEEAVLQPMMRMAIDDLGSKVEEALSFIVPPVIHPVFDLGSLLEMVFDLQSAEPVTAEAPVDGEVEETTILRPHFPQGMQEEAKAWIKREIKEHPTMSALLEAAEKDGKSPKFRECVFFLLMMASHPKSIKGMPTNIIHLGTLFTNEFVHGDDIAYRSISKSERE